MRMSLTSGLATIAVSTVLAAMLAVPAVASADGDGLLTQGTGIGTGGPVDIGDLAEGEGLETGPVAHTGAATYTMVSTPDSVAPHGLAAVGGTSGVSAVTATLRDGAFLAVVIVDDAADPSEYRFQGAVPYGHTAKVQADGSVAIFDAEQNRAGGWETPWAVDADGKPVSTNFTVQGDTLVQTVDHTGHTYPVIADPCGGWSNFLSCVAVGAAVLTAISACGASAGSACGPAVLTVISTVGQSINQHMNSSNPSRPAPPPKPKPLRQARCARPGCR